MLRVRQSRERQRSLRESVFTGVQASPPNRNSFHVSSLPTCPYANVYGGRLTHLLMSFPQLSLTITMRNNIVSNVSGFNIQSFSVFTVHMDCDVISTGLTLELSNNGDKATTTALIDSLLNACWQLPSWTHMETHQQGKLACSAC